jgi:hypothetical protein
MMSRRRFLATTTALGASAALGCTSRTGATTATTAATAVPGGGAEVAAARALLHGVAANRIEDMVAFEAAAGRFVRRYTYYRSWGATNVNMTWETSLVRQLVGRGTTPVLTFQPQDPSGGVEQPAYTHARISAGDFDPLLARWGALLATAGGPVVVRPMHEGNGTWYPWCAGVNGNTPASYVAAWRHIRTVVRAAGATNTRWMWSMNKLYSSAAPPIAALYPGDDVVDEVGFSGYNGGSAVDRNGWRSFDTTFQASLTEAAGICSRPLHISETGCVEQGGDKAAWIADMWVWLAAHPEIAGMTWFNLVKGAADWRVETSAAAQAAYRTGAIATIAPRA